MTLKRKSLAHKPRKPLKSKKSLAPIGKKRAAKFETAGIVPRSTLDKPEKSKAAPKVQTWTDTGPDAETVALIRRRDEDRCACCGDPAIGRRNYEWCIAHRKLRAHGVRKTGFSTTVVAAIVARDEGCCFRCGGYVLHGTRGWDYSIQHRRARGMGGSRRPDTNSVQNGIILCGSATSPGGCHEYVEQHPEEAEDHGWRVPQHGDPLVVAAVHWRDGAIHLHSNGSFGSRPEVTV